MLSYDKGMFHKLSFREWKVPRSWVFAWLLLTASDTRHPSRVNGKKRDVNCRRRFAICSGNLKPGYGYYGFVGYVFVGCNAVIVSGFVVVLHQKHSKTLSTAFIWVVLVVSPKVSPETSWQHFFSPKGTFFTKGHQVENPAPPHGVLCCLRFSWLKSELQNWKPSSNVNDSRRRPWIPWFFPDLESFFSDFFRWVLNGRIWLMTLMLLYGFLIHVSLLFFFNM